MLDLVITYFWLRAQSLGLLIAGYLILDAKADTLHRSTNRRNDAIKEVLTLLRTTVEGNEKCYSILIVQLGKKINPSLAQENGRTALETQRKA